jgi:glycosyltransferase involved in cell wall biosynthesis
MNTHMASTDLPLVSILTPVYNGEAYLEECIESVLAQTYTNFEYLIINNCSKDRTGEIAERYALKDPRIRVFHNDKLLPVIANHNHAFHLMSPDSKYCKVVSGDDLIFPDCVMKMVELAEAHPSIGLVGSYQVSGGGGDEWVVRCTGLPYWRTMISGVEICRLHFLAGLKVFGAPTSNLYRCDLMRATDEYYPNPRAEADISACIKHLQHTDFGFVHQVLSYERCHGDRVTTASRNLDAYVSSRMSDVRVYGPAYLTAAEMDKCLADLLDEYYRFLAIAAVNFRDRTYWQFQKARLAELGYRLSPIRLAGAVCVKLFDLVFSPKETWAKLRRRTTGNEAPSAGVAALPKADGALTSSK